MSRHNGYLPHTGGPDGDLGGWAVFVGGYDRRDAEFRASQVAAMSHRTRARSLAEMRPDFRAMVELALRELERR